MIQNGGEQFAKSVLSVSVSLSLTHTLSQTHTLSLSLSLSLYVCVCVSSLAFSLVRALSVPARFLSQKMAPESFGNVF